MFTLLSLNTGFEKDKERIEAEGEILTRLTQKIISDKYWNDKIFSLILSLKKCVGKKKIINGSLIWTGSQPIVFSPIIVLEGMKMLWMFLNVLCWRKTYLPSL